MSYFYPLTDPAGGGLERQRCAADLDQILLTRDPQQIAAFLDRWGEPLRELIHDFDSLADQMSAAQGGDDE